MVCGIYKITNQVNGKFYIGQSRNIKKRWRQHTSGLNRPNPLSRGSYPLRAAFLKYGLDQFNFDIIEECPEEQLLTREAFWIKEKKPAYNCNILNPGRTPKKVYAKPRFWVQYHNYENLGYLPAELNLDIYAGQSYDFSETLSGINTGKRAVLGAVGDSVFLIVGIGSHPKQYYLWYRFVIEEVQITENPVEGQAPYDALGAGNFVNPPQLLNSNEFDEFKKHCGNFGFGFMNIANSPYLSTLEKLSENYKTEKVDFPQYIEDFFKKVTEVNPNEIAARSKRGIARHLAVSFYPEHAICLLDGVYTKLVVFGITQPVINSGDRLLVHTLDYYEDIEDSEYRTQLKDGCLGILEKFELDEESFPAHAIQGWVEVVDIFQYNEESFAADQDKHGLGDSLESYRDQLYMPEEAQAWCIVCAEPVFFDEPVLIKTPQNIFEAEPWFPITSEEVKAFRSALNH